MRGAVDNIRDQNSQIAAAEQQRQVTEDVNRHIAQIQDDALLVEASPSPSTLALRSWRSSWSSSIGGQVGRFRWSLLCS